MAVIVEDDMLKYRYVVTNPTNKVTYIDTYKIPAYAQEIPVLLTIKQKNDLIAAEWVVAATGGEELTLDYSQITNAPDIGTAAAEDVEYFATAAQGAKADTALQDGAPISAIDGLQDALDAKQDVTP